MAFPWYSEYAYPEWPPATWLEILMDVPLCDVASEIRLKFKRA